MSRAALVRNVVDISAEITRELDSLADRAFELQRQAQALQAKEDTVLVDKAVQADGIGGAAPTYKLERLRRLQPFTYLPFNKRLNWKKIRALNLDRMAREADSRSLMELFNEVAQADLEGESSYNLTEANMVKLVRVCQMMMQCVQHSAEQQLHVQQLLEEDNSEMQANMQLLPNLDMDNVSQGLRKLEKEYYGVADADMDAMFQQVRVEERTGARDLLGGIADQAKKVLEAKVDALESYAPARASTASRT